MCAAWNLAVLKSVESCRVRASCWISCHLSGVPAGAHRSWFHLYRVLMSADAAAGNTLPPGANGASTDHAPAANGGVPAGDLQGQGDPGERRRRSAAVAVEQFVQTAPLGEFERRLELLTSFRRGTRALSVHMPRHP